jgi:hypothetical protein
MGSIALPCISRRIWRLPMLAITGALLAAAPAPVDHALLGPSFAAKAPDALARAIVRRARTALKRPPTPLPRLHTEGTLPGHGIRDISIVAKRDHPITLDLALAWRVTGERAFLDATDRYLVAWAKLYQPSFNPIDETGFDALILAYDLTEADLPDASRAMLDAFWRRMAVGYLDAMEGRPRGAITNWQSHRIKLATLAAFQTGDPALVARAQAAYRRQIAANLRADGSTFDFEERDALHYVTYNLDPLMMAALAAQAHGQAWFAFEAPSGASLPRSLDWLARYARGERTHVEFANSRIAFDRERAAAGQKDFAQHAWNPAKAVNSFALAARLDLRFAATRDALIGRTGQRPAEWMMIGS